ncbi:hypothetical protein H9623_17875 [Oerskovia sp. Sa1BUA8]|uniref:Uncharacterized protein n=1 Tax=Oerskovia douganii TaxID=2762210 RepID=A0A9D5UKG3_9CELL|nr:hypothetical protein [Oerskovia douganii]MBE7702162.1 hypothetical protein [Oerskovia douganii]
MSPELIGAIATALFGSAGVAALLSSAAPLTRPARLRHRIEKDAALAKTFPEGSEPRRALDWSCADAAHQLAAAQLFPTPYRYRYLPLVYGLVGVATAAMGVLLSRSNPDFLAPLNRDVGLAVMLLLAFAYVAYAVRIHRQIVAKWRLFGLLSVEHQLKSKTGHPGWAPREFQDWRGKARRMSRELNTRANGTPQGDPTATMASTEEGEAP